MFLDPKVLSSSGLTILKILCSRYTGPCGKYAGWLADFKLFAFQQFELISTFWHEP
jgi:hypothetical protein